MISIQRLSILCCLTAALLTPSYAQGGDPNSVLSAITLSCNAANIVDPNSSVCAATEVKEYLNLSYSIQPVGFPGGIIGPAVVFLVPERCVNPDAATVTTLSCDDLLGVVDNHPACVATITDDLRGGPGDFDRRLNLDASCYTSGREFQQILAELHAAMRGARR